MYDIIIIGGGPAGLNAALYAGRSGMKTLLFERLFCGGQAATAFEIENYIGFVEPASGPELMMQMEKHARRFGVEVCSKDITRVELEQDIKEVYSGDEKFLTKAVIICTGASARSLDIPGETELRGSGVSYCATCDGAFFRNKAVAVVGGGDTAVGDALFLSTFCSDVYIIHRRDSFRAAKIASDKVINNEKVHILWDSVATEIIGDGAVSGITVRNIKTDKMSVIDVSAVFVAVGTVANGELFADKLNTDGGYIVTDESMQTSIKGVYAAGDIRSKLLRQVITAAADGAIAAYAATNYILTLFE